MNTGKQDRELRVLQKPLPRNRFRSLMPFKTIVRNRLRLNNEVKPSQPVRKKKLQEILSQPDNDGGLVTSIFSIIPIDAKDREQSLLLVLNEVRKMSEKMNIAVTCIGFNDGQIGK